MLVAMFTSSPVRIGTQMSTGTLFLDAPQLVRIAAEPGMLLSTPRHRLDAASRTLSKKLQCCSAEFEQSATVAGVWRAVPLPGLSRHRPATPETSSKGCKVQNC